MYGWIIYNGALRITKIETLVARLSTRAKEKGMTLELVKNNELLPSYGSKGEATLKTLNPLKKPEFIVFWDKDIFLAKHLEMMGFKLFNSREAIEICDNKALTQLKLANLGIPMPKTLVGPFVFHKQNLSDRYIDQVFETLGPSVILKESHGSFGMQVYKVDDPQAFREKVEAIGNNPFIMQEYIETTFGRDVRVNIIGNKIVGAMERQSSEDFRANITLGGVGKVVQLTEMQEQLALNAHQALGLDFSGIDLLYGENDAPILCEVNSNVNYLSYEDLSGLDFSGLLIDYIEKQVK